MNISRFRTRAHDLDSQVPHGPVGYIYPVRRQSRWLRVGSSAERTSGQVAQGEEYLRRHALNTHRCGHDSK